MFPRISPQRFISVTKPDFASFPPIKSRILSLSQGVPPDPAGPSWLVRNFGWKIDCATFLIPTLDQRPDYFLHYNNDFLYSFQYGKLEMPQATLLYISFFIFLKQPFSLISKLEFQGRPWLDLHFIHIYIKYSCRYFILIFLSICNLSLSRFSPEWFSSLDVISFALLYSSDGAKVSSWPLE